MIRKLNLFLIIFSVLIALNAKASTVQQIVVQGNERISVETIKMFSNVNIGQNIGKAAGQSIMWPHVHLIPRHKGDCDTTKHNGVRLSAPNGNHREFY